MNLLKNFLKSAYDSGRGAKTACEDEKSDFMMKRGTRRFINSSVAVLLVAAMLAAGGCSSRSASSSSSEESDTQSSSSSEAEESSSSEADQPPVELLASATKYNPIESTQLSRLIQDRAKVYKEEAAATVPTSGDLNAWKKINSDTVGWINVPGTNVNYPVLYHTNNNYYTSRGYYKEYSHSGVIWLDQDTRFNDKGAITSTNTIIYGHNWTNYSRPIQIGRASDIMFAQLAAYDDETFAKEHQYIYLNTFDGPHKYQVFSVFYTDLSFQYWYAESPQMKNIIDTAISKSLYKFDVPMTEKDQFITISTCTRVLGPGDNQRFVIMAKKVS